MPDNAAMSKTLDAEIDALYAVPLAQFVAARTALAKTVSGAEARRIKALAKPTTLPWVINQVRWHERTLYERVMKAGAALRAAQIDALEGRGAKVAEATTHHRQALGDAVAAGQRLAAAAGVNADADALQRMLETVSLAESLPEAHGRFTELVQPAGFEALFGVAVKPVPPGQRAAASAPARTPPVTGAKPTSVDLAAVRAAAKRAREEADAVERHEKAIAAAEKKLAAARDKETDAREAWHKARDLADAADRELHELKKAARGGR